MRVGITVYDHLDVKSGGYLYDRKLVDALRERDHEVIELHQPGGSYRERLQRNLDCGYVERVTDAGLDLLVQDELNHPSLFLANRLLRRRVRHPILTVVHHLTCAEQRSPWQNRLHAAVETAYMRSVEGFICNTRATLRTVRHLAGNNQPAVIAYPAADRVAPSLTEEEVRDRVRRGHSLCVLFIGNLIARKGLDVLLEAFATLREDLPFALDVVGGDEADPLYARQMRTLVKGLGLADRVVFHGHVEGESLRDLYRQADVLAVPSSYEGFGIVYLEGMAFGLPAIATLQGGAREVVTHAENGFLVPYGAVDRIAGFLRLFARRGDLLERFSLAALQRYERHDTWAQSMGRAVAFMERMASGHSRP